MDTLGLAATVDSVVCVHKEPFYGMSRIRKYNRDGTNAGAERFSRNFIRVLRRRVAARYPQVGLLQALESAGQSQTNQDPDTQEQSATPSTLRENGVDTSDTLGQMLETVEWECNREQDDNHHELQQINEEQATNQVDMQQTSTDIEGVPNIPTVPEPSTQNNDSSQSQLDQQAATTSSQVEHSTNDGTGATSPVERYALIMGTQSDEVRTSDRNAKLTWPFKRHKGIVPRSLFGNRGKCLIKLLKNTS